MYPLPRNNSLISSVSKPAARPNTAIHYPLFVAHQLNLPHSQLNIKGWDRATLDYPDRAVITAILGICRYGARIGYEGHRTTPIIYPNLPIAQADEHLLSSDIAVELGKNHFAIYPDPSQLPNHYTASTLGLIDKSDGSKRRIHHLSYPPLSVSSINSGIPEHYGTISYSTVTEAIEAIQGLGKDCILVKHDFEAAFQHIPVSPVDSPLLGFRWENTYYSELFLPFGLRTAPYLFNIFAEVFHWILESALQKESLPVSIIHYLDDFLLVLPPGADFERYSTRFSTLCAEVGLAIKTAKNEEGSIASFAGVEFDNSNMVICLPPKKLQKARGPVQTAIAKKSLSLLELQSITGYPNFVSIVVPLGRTFLRRLYNLELYFPAGSRHQNRRMSSEALKDLASWDEILSQAPQRSIHSQKRETISTWTDAASTKGLGAFFISNLQPIPQPDMAFSIAVPRDVSRKKEHINTQEMRAVEQALLYWGPSCHGKRVLVHTDNRSVPYGIAKRTIRSGSMEVLRRCLLLAAEYDLELEAEWISTNANELADALSRFDYEKITDLAPQLIQEICSPQKHGWRTYNTRDSLVSPPIICREASHPPPDAITKALDPFLGFSASSPTTATTTEDASQPKLPG